MEFDKLEARHEMYFDEIQKMKEEFKDMLDWLEIGISNPRSVH